jgi:glycoside/pentoside/hexuronide:cation symporter, GPH family
VSAAGSAADLDRVPLPIKLAHGLGSVAYGVKDNGFSTFLLLFYNQVIGIDAGLVGTAIMLALIVDAFADPLIGHLSDNTHSRWGRRLPWLYAAPIPLGFAWMLLWYPPQGDTTITLLWLVGTAIIVRTLVSMCEVPSVALVPELTRDYHERTLLMRYRFLFGWVGGLLILTLAYGVFMAPTAEHPDGLTNAAGYHVYALCGAIMMVLSVLISALGQHRRIQSLPALLREPAGTPGHGWHDMKATLSNRPFLWLVGSALFGFVNQGITFSMTNYMLSYVWRFTQGAMTSYALMLLISIVIAFVVVGPMANRWGKRGGAIRAGIVAMAFNSALLLSYLFDLIPVNAGRPSVAVVFAFVLASNSFAIILMILSSSMMADVVEASQAETGRRSEGLFFAGYFFMQKCATGIGIFVAGMILSVAGFPENAVAGQVAAPVIDRLVLYYMLILAVIGTIGLLVMRRFPISRADHEARLAVLDQAARADPDANVAHP